MHSDVIKAISAWPRQSRCSAKTALSQLVTAHSLNHCQQRHSALPPPPYTAGLTQLASTGEANAQSAPRKHGCLTDAAPCRPPGRSSKDPVSLTGSEQCERSRDRVCQSMHRPRMCNVPRCIRSHSRQVAVKIYSWSQKWFPLKMGPSQALAKYTIALHPMGVPNAYAVHASKC